MTSMDELIVRLDLSPRVFLGFASRACFIDWLQYLHGAWDDHWWVSYQSYRDTLAP